jgi:hypothetical protein
LDGITSMQHIGNRTVNIVEISVVFVDYKNSRNPISYQKSRICKL